MPHSPHIATKKHPHPKVAPHKITNFDKLVFVVSFLYPLSALPQIIAVFNGRTEGVAVLSWIVFLLCASLFFTYGMKRRVMPMIITNSIWVIMDSLVIVGVLLNASSITWI